MAPMASNPAFSEVGLAGSNGEAAAPVTQALPRSRSLKNKLQQHVNSWKRQNRAEKLVENVSKSTLSTDNTSLNPVPRNAYRLSERYGGNNATSSSNQITSIMSTSLDSLTSASLFSRNSFPSMISTGTDATSVSGVFTTCGITFSVDSPSVKKYKQMKNNLIVYLARDDIEIPLDVVEQWEATDLERLRTDLSEVVMRIYRKGLERESRRARNVLYSPPGPHEYDISFELRMSGRATRNAPHVAIVPSIWVVCGSTWACKEIRAAMDEITWPTLPMEIHEGRVPIPSVAEGQVDMGKLDLTNGYHLGDGITLYIHVEESLTDDSSCGLICCATIQDGDTYSHHFSRIGGLVMTTNTLTSSKFGVSTAHGMLDHPWWHRQLWKGNSATTWDCQSIESTDSEDEYEFDSDSLYDDREGLYTEPPDAPFPLDDNDVGEGYRDPRLVSRWRNIGYHGVLSFLGASISKENNLQQHIQLYDDIGMQTDHAMISLEWPQDTSSQPRDNKYCAKSALSETPIDITTHMSNDKLSEGVVSIICETNSSIDGHLLPGSTCLAMGGRMFILRKVKTENPVARGVSGSWVARGTELCGMVIAVSNPEPYVYMMRAEDLICNIGASSPSIETVEVFSSHSRKAKQKTSETLPRRSSSSKSQRRLVTAITSPKVSVDAHSSMTSIKRSLSTKLSSFGGSSKLHDGAVKDTYRQKGMKPHRTRSVRGRLSDIFNTKVEEIVQPSGMKGVDIKQVPGLPQLNSAGNRIHSCRPVQVKRRPLPKRVCTMRMPLEPISEVSSLSGLGVDSVADSEYALLQSTAHSLTTMFRHGHIRLPKSDLLPEGKLDVTEGRGPPECPEYDNALCKTAHYWLYGNYETQQEEKVDEIGDLIDWWDSWGIDDGLIAEQEDEPLSPTCTTSDDFPGVSYSDTTSEDSISSYPPWTSRPVSAAEEDCPKYSYVEDNVQALIYTLSTDDDSGLGLGVMREPAGGGNPKGTAYEIYGGHGIIA
ncbi:hypothetical protein GGS24DRAFT_231338 [Hypoxylon argillaceum]|nr:hypothetical protein GGS24DRAFT_231338 [Hypoxylon argillaceum]